MVPTLCFKLEFLVVASDKNMSEACFGDVANEMHIVYLLNLLMVANGHCEQQFIVLATIECTGGDIHVQLFGHDSCLVVDRQLLLKDAASHT